MKPENLTEEPVVTALAPNTPKPKPLSVNGTKVRPLLPLTSIAGPRTITAAYSDIELPSMFIPYEWKDLQIKQLSIQGLSAIIKARTAGNLRHLVRAIDETCSRPISEMTYKDFWFVMYWHRLNSFKRLPYVLSWSCSEPSHLTMISEENDVEEKQRLVNSLQNVVTVTNSNLSIDELTDELAYLKLQEEILQEFGVHVRPRTIRDQVEYLEFSGIKDYKATKALSPPIEPLDIDAEIDQLLEVNEEGGERARIQYLESYAGYIGDEHGNSFEEKLDFLEAQPADLIAAIDAFDKVSNHGVREEWTAKCKGCGSSRTITASLDYHSFFPAV